MHLRAFLQSWKWLVAAGAVVGVAEVFRLTSAAQVYPPDVGVVTGVLIAVPVLSGLMGTQGPSAMTTPVSPIVRRQAFGVGRSAAWCVLVLLLLSVGRAFTAPMLVGPHRGGLVALIFGCLIGASALAGLVLSTGRQPSLLASAGADRATFSRWHPQRVGSRDTGHDLVEALPLAAVTILTWTALLVFPSHISRVFGLVGTLGLCLAALTAFYATLAVAAQIISPPRVFGALGLRRTPVIGLVVVMALLSTFVGTNSPLHRIRPPASASVSRRPTADEAAEQWLDAPSMCVIDTGATLSGHRALRARPMIFVATEGGGARAAVWTVDAMTALTRTPCGERPVFLVSGVSGGATGLAVLDTSPDPPRQIRTLVGSDASSAALEGLLSRDLLAGVLGLDIRAVDAPADESFPDRAALLEQAWERAVPGLKAGFPLPSRGVGWRTIFNSTSVVNNCRILVSDVDLGPDADSCANPRDPVPSAYDLFGSVSAKCDLGVRTSTAALLAARFPFLTPSGLIPACRGAGLQDQAIDGGYAENTGIDTVNGVMSSLMPLIRDTNSRAVGPTGDGVVTVPLVVFLHNSEPVADERPPKPNKPRAEVWIPPLGGLGDSAFLGSQHALLQTSANISQGWLPGSRTSVYGPVSSVFSSQALVVSPLQVPQTALSLGWSLSKFSEDSMAKGLSNYLTCAPSERVNCSSSLEFDRMITRWTTAPNSAGTS